MTNREAGTDIYADELDHDVLNDLWDRWDSIVPSIIEDVRAHGAASSEIVWEMLPQVSDAVLDLLITPDMTFDNALMATERYIRETF